MRRRLIRLVAMSLVVPVAVKAATMVADRLEASGGPSTTSRSLRKAAAMASRRKRRGK